MILWGVVFILGNRDREGDRDRKAREGGKKGRRGREREREKEREREREKALQWFEPLPPPTARHQELGGGVWGEDSQSASWQQCFLQQGRRAAVRKNIIKIRKLEPFLQVTSGTEISMILRARTRLLELVRKCFPFMITTPKSTKGHIKGKLHRQFSSPWKSV